MPIYYLCIKLDTHFTTLIFYIHLYGVIKYKKTTPRNYTPVNLRHNI